MIDQTGILFEEIKLGMGTVDKDVEIRAFDTEEEAKKQIVSEGLTGYLLIESDEQEIVKGVYKANTLSDTDYKLAAVRCFISNKIKNGGK